MITIRRIMTLTALAGMLTAGAPLFAQRGRGVPNLPPQSRVPAGRFPGFPPNAGVGQPADVGQPTTLPPDQANPRASEGGTIPDQPLAGAPTTGDQLSRNTRLSARLAEMLGVAETGLTTEPDGFGNLGLFVATVNVSSHVEGTTFDGLKAAMLDDGMSLGEAIQAETALSESEAAEAAEEATEEATEIIEETS